MPEMEAATEYTLQGVMRFLQIEWHNHERARNAWDIERAEMKAKIAKQEGDYRSAKKMNDMLERQVKMLEQALKYERAKGRALANGEEPPKPPSEAEVKKGWDGKIGVKPSPSLPGIELHVEGEISADAEREAQRDKSKIFLQKCLEEITYLLTPPAHPVPPQANHQSQHSSFEPQDVTLQDAYAQQPQLPQSQLPRRRNPQLSHLPSLPNQGPSSRASSDYYQQSQHIPQPDTIPQHGLPGSAPDPLTIVPDDLQPQERLTSRTIDEPVEQITHSFDAYGRAIPNPAPQSMVTDTNGWDFGEEATTPEPDPNGKTAHSRLEQTDQFPDVSTFPAKSPPRPGHASHRRKSSGSTSGHLGRKRSEGSHDLGRPREPQTFEVKFALRGHLDVVRSVIFTGGGSPSEPEICTTGDDGTIKRWIIPASYHHSLSPANSNSSQPPPTLTPPDADITSCFTHRGHDGLVTSLAACPANHSPASPSFSTGGRASGDGWIFSGGQDATIRVWERGRVDAKATLVGHTDAVWALAVLPASATSVLAGADPPPGNPSLSATAQPVPSRDDRILLASGAADGTIKIWAVSAPPQFHSPQPTPTGGRRNSRRLSVTSGSNFPSSPQPNSASGTPFHYQLVHNIDGLLASPTSIAPLGAGGESFAVAFADAQCVVFDTKTAESVVGMQSQETWDQTPSTGINAVVVATKGMSAESDGSTKEGQEGEEVHGATGSGKDGGVEGVVITGHEDRYVRFFDANSGQCTYSMLAHPASIASLSLSPDGRELLTAGHDASVRVWNLEKRSCTQEVTCHRVMRGEGVVSACWSFDGRWIVTAGGDGVVKVLGKG